MKTADLNDRHRERGNLIEIVEGAAPLAGAIAPLLTVAEHLRSDAFKRPRRTLVTNFDAFNRLVGGGLKSRQQSTWAAPTGTGKTGLAGTIMLALAQAGRPIYWLATELDAAEQAARFATLALKLANRNATPDMLLSHELPPEHAAAAADGLPIYVRRWRRRMGDPFVVVRADAQLLLERHKEPPVIVVDYLQKLAVEDEERRRLSVSNVSEEFLDIAQDFDTHVMAISSVSRAFYNAAARKARKAAEDEDPRDWLAVGKESGDLEYDAAVVVYLDVADEKSQLGERDARLVVAKARGGDVGFAGLKFHGPSGLFVADDAAASALRPQARAANVNKPGIREALLAFLRARRLSAPTKETIEAEFKGFAATAKRSALKALVAEGDVETRVLEYVNARGRQCKKTVFEATDDGAMADA